MKKYFTLFLFTVCNSNLLLSQTPVALRPDISIAHVLNVELGVTRLAYNPIDHSFYYSTMSGNIYKIIMPPGGQAYDTLIYTVSHHGVQYVQGMAFYDSSLYVSGNNEKSTPLTTGTIQRGDLVQGYSRVWVNVAHTVPYQTADAFDHLFSGMTLNPAGDTILICSGSRGDHGEVQTRYGVYPGLRNLPVTSLILQVPASAANLVIPNDSALLVSQGRVFAYGIRNTYDFEYNAKGDLFGVENSCDRDMEEEINWLRKGRNYGFPWMMGGSYNPQQFSWFNPAADLLINHNCWAWSLNAFYNDPSFPQKPAGLQLTLPCLNYGPDAAFMRDSAAGTTYNAAAASQAIRSFTPHRSPLGITIDKDSILGSDLRGNTFVLSYTRGNGALHDSSALLVPFNDSGEDLLMLKMEKDIPNDNYFFHAYKIAGGFNHPVDAVLLDTVMYVMEVDFSGTTSLWKINFPSFLHSLPAATITPAGPVTFCSGGNVVLNATTGSGLTYAWKKNGVIIGGATSASYTATATGSYTVVVTNSFGSSTSPSVTVTNNPNPSAAVTPSGPTTFCAGGSVLLNAAVAANRAYQWKKNAVNISGATSSSYTANTSGTYKVTVTNTVTGCTKTTNPGIVVTKNPLPTAAITPSGTISFCAGQSALLTVSPSGGYSYQWKKNNANISGAVGATYTAATAGKYKVIVTNNTTGCSKTSLNDTVVVPCREGEIESENVFDVKVYPNPSSGDFIFEIGNSTDENISIEVFDVIGKIILSETIHNSTFIIHNSSLSPGIYMAVVSAGENKKSLKIIKTE
ncbi:MAG: T9SS type A sorting domain-containing protein [Bacteroidia bacterium]